MSSPVKEAGLVDWLRGIFTADPKKREAERFIKSDDPAKWDATLRRQIQDPNFASWVQKLTPDPKLRVHVKSLHDMSQGPVVANIEGSSGKKYDLKKLPGGRLGCTCRDWHYKGSVDPNHKCKHIRAFESGRTKVSTESSMSAFAKELEALMSEERAAADAEYQSAQGEAEDSQEHGDLLAGEGAHTVQEYAGEATEDPDVIVGTNKWASFNLALMEKLAARLNKAERDNLEAQYAAVGASAAPLAGMASNLLSQGRLIPKGIKPWRYLAGTTAGGAIFSGAIPSVQKRLADAAEDKASERVRRKRISKALAAYHAGRVAV